MPTRFALHNGSELVSGDDLTEFQHYKTYAKGMTVKLVHPPSGFDRRFDNCVAVVQLILGRGGMGTAVYFYVSVQELQEDVRHTNRKKRRVPGHNQYNTHPDDLIKVSTRGIANLSKMDELLHVALSELQQAPTLPVPAPVPEPPPPPASSVRAFPDLDSHRERRKLDKVMLRIAQLEQPHRNRQHPAAPQASLSQGPRLRSSNAPKRRRGAPSAKSQPSRAIPGHRLLGKFVLKVFTDQMYRGRVTRVSTAGAGAVYEFRPGLTSAVKCFVRYEDGDSEHMTPAEVERLLVR